MKLENVELEQRSGYDGVFSRHDRFVGACPRMMSMSNAFFWKIRLHTHEFSSIVTSKFLYFRMELTFNHGDEVSNGLGDISFS